MRQTWSRRSLRQIDLLVDTSRFPQKSHVLPRSDPWTLPAVSGHSLLLGMGLRGFSLAVLQGDVESAWSSFCDSMHKGPKILQQVERSHCSKFLAMLPSGSVDAASGWPRAQEFYRFMANAGYTPSVADYSVLLNSSFKAKDYDAVEAIWQDMQRRGVEPDVVAWNQYIQATTLSYPRFWPNRNPVLKNWQRIDLQSLPPKTNDIELLLKKMSASGVRPNSRTYELTILAFARQNHLELCDKVVKDAWLASEISEDSSLAPDVSTLTSIVEAYAFNGQVHKGYQLAKLVQAKHQIPLTASSAQTFWTVLFRHVRLQTEPRGDLPTEYFYELWGEMQGKFRVAPGMGLYNIRVEYLDWKNQFGSLEQCIQPILKLGHKNSWENAKAALAKTIKGLSNTGHPLDAVRVMETWALQGLDLRDDLEEYVRRRGGTKAQLDMYRDDDDEESILGY